MLEQAAPVSLPTITQAARDAGLPLSFAQQRLWFLTQMHGVSAAYHLPVGLRLSGQLDRQALRRALDRLVARHESLRTTFGTVDGEPVQRIGSARSGFALSEHDLRGTPEQLAELVQQELQAKFDLQAGPLIRGRLVALDTDEHALLITMHHIVSDGWSIGVLIRELGTLYVAYCRRRADPLPSLSIQYADYALWQRRRLSEEVLQEQSRYWRETLAGAPARLELPTDRPRPAQQDYAGDWVELQLDAHLTSQLQALSQRHGMTLFMTVLAGWALVLSRLSGQQEVVIGTPVANRNRADVEALIGFFVNTLALRLEVADQWSVGQLLWAVKERALQAQQHQDLPFEQVVAIVQPPRSLAHSAVFQVMLAWQQNIAPRALELPKLKVTGLPNRPASAKFDLSLALGEVGGRIVGELEYATALFERATIERHVEYLRTALAGMVTDEQRAIARIELLSAWERQRLLVEWNATEAVYPEHLCVQELFEAQVERTPSKIAITSDHEQLSYGQLNARANQLARYLRQLGVAPEKRVAVCMERSIDMVVGLLAILKAGGAYVPLDPSYPSERLAYMLTDSASVAVLTHGAVSKAVKEVLSAVAVIDLQVDADRWCECSTVNPIREGLAAEHLAYVIYTSGSTGRPKAVANSIGGLVNRLCWFVRAVGQDAPVSALKTSIGFVDSVTESLQCLLSGGRLVVFDRAAVGDLSVFAQRIERYEVSQLVLVPSLLAQLLDSEAAALSCVRVLICSGERLTGELVRRVKQRYGHLRVFNLYGSSEVNGEATAWECEEGIGGAGATTSVIGRPIANTHIYILDRQGEPVPTGVVGEIYIGGASVARGYLNHPALTAERFVSDPFAGEPAARLYRSGDLGRYLPNGEIEFIGRTDFQVKIRGFRIELGEIEARLAMHAGIREAVVLSREDVPGEKRLVAYYTLTEPQLADEVNAAELREHLSEQLPQYMVPAVYVRLQSLPLMMNGKLDRKALPAPEGESISSQGYEAPQGELEERLARLWQELLQVERVGRHDNFFALGGHSLLVMKLIEQMGQAGLRADVRALFTTPTLSALAAAVRGGGEVLAEVPPNLIEPGCVAITPAMLPLVQLTIEQIERIVASVPGGVSNIQDIYPLAPLQEGILFHHLTSKGGDPYLLYVLLSFDRRERLDEFLRALQAVMDRHDVLRTAVLWEDLPEPVQVVWRQAPLHVEEVQIDAADIDVASQLRAHADPRQYRLDVRSAPLMRIVIARDERKERWLLMWMLHHLCGDATTFKSIQQEVQAYLAGEAEQLLDPVAFRTFVAHARLGVSREEHERFFRELLGDVDEPTAPYGLVDVQGDGSNIRETVQPVDARLARRLRACARVLGVSAASVFHVAFAQVLARVSGREDVVFGSVLFGRMQAASGADRALGLFINTLPVRIKVGDVEVASIVRQTHALLAQLLRHEHASLALVQRCSGVAAPAPLFSALLNYRHNVQREDAARIPDVIQGIEILEGLERTNYPFCISVDDLGEGFKLTVQVQAPIDPQSICTYLQIALEGLVRALEQAPQQPLRSLSILPQSERQRLLVEWNATEAAYQKNLCVHELFEAQVRRTPQATAVVYEQHQLSYGELNARANQLAHHLRSLGVEPDSRVAICVERSLEMVIGLLAILKAGGAYVPLDPSYPAERLAYMLTDSAPVAVLTHGAVSEAVKEVLSAAPVIDLQADADRWCECSATDPSRKKIKLESKHLAYVIYTSGSTGRPKGVMVEHRNVVRLFACTQDWYRFDADDVWTLFHSYAFDFSVWEIWGALLYGGRLVMVPQLTARAPEEFYALLCRQGVTILNQTPSAFRQLLSAQAQSSARHRLRQVIFGGEALEVTTLEPWYAQNDAQQTQLVNMYGITETTVHVTYRPLEPADTQLCGRNPIGARLPDLRVYLLDRHQQPVPIGVAGEIYVGGAGVARGYLNHPEQTAERFVNDPFAEEPAARMYRSGDLGRYLPNGEIEFLGRTDFQVKIRGFRIELGEIEARLTEHAGVREAVVLAREDVPGEKRLVAYYTLSSPQPAQEVSAAELREHLSRQLPEYMVPAAYERLDTLPLTVNGKLDRAALPVPQAGAYAACGYEAPAGEIETLLAQSWAQVLGVERVGRHDNFFALGGHSFLAVKLIERMRRVGLQADVRALFTTPTLSALAAAVRGGGEVLAEVPPNLIEPGCVAITPAMLPLVQLTIEQIERIVASVPGGVSNIQDIYPLAPLQEGILFHHLTSKGGDPYLLYVLLSFDRRERLDEFLRALQAVMDRHDVLRTAVLWEDLPEPVQVVWRQAPLHVEEVQIDAADIDVASQLRAHADPRQYRLDVRSAPLMRIVIARDERKERWLLMWMLHHLCGDATTFKSIQQEVQAYLAGEAEQLLDPVAFRTFVAHARLGVSREEHERFFRELLGDVDEPTAPYGLVDVQGDGSNIRETVQPVDARLARRLRACARVLGVSAASVFHVAFAQVLARVSGREDVVFGSVLFGRMQAASGADRALGLFINTLPVRIKVGDVEVASIVRQTHALLAQLLRHEHASLALVQRCSGVAAPAPLFSALLNYRHNVQREDAARIPDVIQGIEILEGLERTNYPFCISVDDLGEGFKLTVQVQAPIDPQSICTYLQIALEGLVRALEQAPQQPLRSLSILPQSERQRLLVEWNATEAAYQKNLCVHELFEAQVRRTPQATAVVYEQHQLSYGELNARANQLAHHLRSLGVEPDSRVAICVERSLEMVIGLLAILKAGGAYVPLDPSYPAERLAYMLTDSAPVAVLTHGAVSEAVKEVLSAAPVIDLQADADRWCECSTTDPSRKKIKLESKHLAYVIYTSGSTGRPKGVMVEHRSVVNRLQWMHDAYGLTERDAVLQKTPFGFDVSVWEFFWPLLHGAPLVMARAEGHKDASYLASLIQQHSITTLHFVPSMLQAFLDHEGIASWASVRRVICSGEALPAAAARRFHKLLPQAQLHNLYGPTEATVDVTAWQSTGERVPEAIPIGRPIANTHIYILDRQGEPVPTGVAGEIYIGGAGVARGYLNRPELTAERFVKDPFVDEPVARLYRTGDLGRYLPSGEIEFIGRTDFQVKIRGFRIELGEIEARLAMHAGVREAVVLARQDVPGEKRLVAYYTLTEPQRVAEVSAAELRELLLQQLPEYMVPAAYVRLESLPLTVNGKLDRASLPAPEADAYAAQGYEAPQGEIEALLAQLWVQVLGADRVGRHDNFFALGGHSLLAMKLIERMRGAGLQADVRTLFTTPTLSAFAAALSGEVEALVEVPPNLIEPGCAAITPAMLPLVQLTVEQIERIVVAVPGGVNNIQDIYPLAPLQEGILFHHLMSRSGDPYLLHVLLSFATRELLYECMGALQAVIDRHDLLRTAVLWEGLPEPVQVVWRQASLRVEEVQIDEAGSEAIEQLRAHVDPRQYRLDVRTAPLMRMVIARDERNERWLLMWLWHHLVEDVTSQRLMLNEVQMHLRGEQQLAAAVPFRNFVARARMGVSREEHERFFRELLGDVDEPTAPYGLVDVQGDGTGIQQSVQRVDEQLAQRLRACARTLGVSAASIFHVAFAQVLARVSSREDVVFGSVLFGRMQGAEGIDRALGVFVNTLPVRVRVHENSALDSVRQTHALLAQLLRHEHVPLVLAQRCSAVAAPAPLFSALLNYRHNVQRDDADRIPSVIQGVEILEGQERTNYPFCISVDDLGEGFELMAQMQAPIDPQSICAYLQIALEGLVRALEQAPQQPLRSLSILPESERQRLLVEWNATEAVYPEHLCVQELFEAQVERTPSKIAITSDHEQLSYGQLNARANQLARYLRQLGVAPEKRVAVCMERSIDMVVGLLAILKAGGAYVPLDPSYPSERLAYMLTDSASVAVLTHGAVSKAVKEVLSAVAVIDLQVDADRWCECSTVNPIREGLAAEHLAYVIYTSGSTGRPKAVANSIGGLVNRLCWFVRAVGQDAPVSALKTSIGFVDSVTESLQCLLSGGRLVVFDRAAVGDLSVFAQRIERYEVSQLVLVPSLLAQLLDSEAAALSCVRVLICSGERLTGELVRRVKQRYGHLRVFNLYGSSEVNGEATAWECEEGIGGAGATTSVIGRPIANTHIYILDRQGEPVPTGVVGEIYIGGASVARGYLNHPALTAERFVSDPFAGEPAARLYRSGDLGRYLPNGEIEFIGRTDFQVKIRGFRIELGEIEARLAMHAGIREAVVLSREDVPGEKRLVAYYTLTEPQLADEVNAAELREHLSQHLPEYMVPAAYVRLEVLPLTVNGKLDRASLPAPEADAYAAQGYEAPQGELEERLARLWQELLQVERVGRHDNFFALGGHSLLVMKLIEQMGQAGLRADVHALFTTPTLAELATEVEMEISL